MLRFDFTGIGASEGEFANTNFSSNVQDLVAAADYLQKTTLAAERFSVRLSHRRIHAEDCADCETKEGNIGEITRDITIEGDIADAADGNRRQMSGPPDAHPRDQDPFAAYALAGC